MSDALSMEYINSLPQPFMAKLFGGGEWPVYDIDVETGLVRIDVCGLLEVTHIGQIASFLDDSGVMHESEDFYSDAMLEAREESNNG